jgi:hypothetical protein
LFICNAGRSPELPQGTSILSLLQNINNLTKEEARQFCLLNHTSWGRICVREKMEKHYKAELLWCLGDLCFFLPDGKPITDMTMVLPSSVARISAQVSAEVPRLLFRGKPTVGLLVLHEDYPELVTKLVGLSDTKMGFKFASKSVVDAEIKTLMLTSSYGKWITEVLKKSIRKEPPAPGPKSMDEFYTTTGDDK